MCENVGRRDELLAWLMPIEQSVFQFSVVSCAGEKNPYYLLSDDSVPSSVVPYFPMHEKIQKLCFLYILKMVLCGQYST